MLTYSGAGEIILVDTNDFGGGPICSATTTSLEGARKNKAHIVIPRSNAATSQAYRLPHDSLSDFTRAPVTHHGLTRSGQGHRAGDRESGSTRPAPQAISVASATTSRSPSSSLSG